MQKKFTLNYFKLAHCAKEFALPTLNLSHRPRSHTRPCKKATTLDVTIFNGNYGNI